MTKLSSGVSDILISVKPDYYIANFGRGVEAHFTGPLDMGAAENFSGTAWE
jgi:hypothetical protein